jgi:hypothetical protein
MADNAQASASMKSASGGTRARSQNPKPGRLKPWHWYSITFLLILAVPLLWFVLAYGGLPRLWSHHEHKKIGSRDQIQSYTAQDIPGDPINLHLKGSQQAITCAFKRAGWSVADPVSLRSAVEIGSSVLLQQPYPQAPVSPLFFQDQQQTVAFEKDEGKSADKRHHVRVWQVGENDWLGAATFDRGVGVSLFTLQITHHIGPDVDSERDNTGKILAASGGKPAGTQPSRIPPNQWQRNGGGDRYRTDGNIRIYEVPSIDC